MTGFASYFKVISASVFLCLPVVARALPQQTIPPPAQVNPPADDKAAPGAADKKISSVPLPSAGGAPVNSSTYKIGAADVLSILVWKEPEFSGNFAVHEDGKFTMPLIGDLDAGGKTPMEVQDILTDTLKKYVVKPLVTVTVAAVGSKRYFMDGLIARPGEYPLVVPTTILEAISKAGGVNDFANVKKIYVLRGDKRIFFNLKDVIRGRHMEQNILLQPGDYVVIP